jgi:predicted membrane-bound spermidine synthase
MVLVTRQELALIALQEIRSFPGAEYVTTVEVDPQVDKAIKTNWTLHVFTREGADMARVQYAITTTRKRLRHRYELRWQSWPAGSCGSFKAST